MTDHTTRTLARKLDALANRVTLGRTSARHDTRDGDLHGAATWRAYAARHRNELMDCLGDIARGEP